MSKKINIVYLIPGLGVGGAEKLIVDIARQLDKTRFKLTVLHWGDESLTRDIATAGVDVIKLNFKKIISDETVSIILEKLRELQVDILHTQFLDADLLGWMLSGRMKIVWIISVHSFPFPEKWTHRLRYHIMSYRCRQIICVSETVKKFVQHKSLISSNKLSVIHNGVNVEKFSIALIDQQKKQLKTSFGFSDDDIILGNISRLIEDKGQEFIIRAMPMILKESPKVRLLIVGDGHLREYLNDLAQELGVKEKIIFAGTRHDIAELLNITDIFIFPTFREALGITVLEAMAAGKVIIASNDAAIVELIEDQKNGVLISPGDTDVIVKAVRDLLNNSSKRIQLAQQARQAVEKFSITSMIKKLEDLYYQISER